LLGLGYRDYQYYFYSNNIKPYSYTTWVKIEAEMKDKINLMYENTKKNIQNKENIDNVIVSIDFAWSHQREADEGMLVVIELNQGLVLESQSIERCKECKSKNQIRECDSGLFHGSSQEMEGSAVDVVFQRLYNNDINIHAVVHDQDSSSMNIIKKYYHNVEEYIDKNHYLNSTEKKMNQSKLSKLKGIGTRLKKFITKCLYHSKSKIDFIENMDSIKHHIVNDHSYCKEICPFKKNENYEKSEGEEWKYQFLHPNDTKELDEIEKEIEIIKNDLTYIFHPYSTNMVEGFHRIRKKYTPKDKNYSKTFDMRCKMAVLEKNCQNWKTTLMQFMDLPIENEMKNEVEKIEQKRENEKKRKKTDQNKKNKYKNKKRKKARSNKKSKEYHYKLSCNCRTGCVNNKCICYSKNKRCNYLCGCEDSCCNKN